jgi:hypothetical protein
MRVFKGLIVAICLLGTVSKVVQHGYRHLHPPAATRQ